MIDSELWVDLLLEEQAVVSTITPADMAEVERIVMSEFGRYGTEEESAWNYTKSVADWTISLKATVNNRIAGVYVLGNNRPEQWPEYHQDRPGVEGVALIVLPEFRSTGVARQLKDAARDAARTTGKKYMWGMQLKQLNNLPHWLKTRKLLGVTDDGEAHVTAEEL